MARVEERMRIPKELRIDQFPHEIHVGDVGYFTQDGKPKEFTVLSVGGGGLVSIGFPNYDRKNRLTSISWGGSLALSEIGGIVAGRLSRQKIAEALRERYKGKIPKDALAGLKKNPLRTLTREDFEAAKAWQAKILSSLPG